MFTRAGILLATLATQLLGLESAFAIQQLYRCPLHNGTFIYTVQYCEVGQCVANGSFFPQDSTECAQNKIALQTRTQVAQQQARLTAAQTAEREAREAIERQAERTAMRQAQTEAKREVQELAERDRLHKLWWEAEFEKLREAWDYVERERFDKSWWADEYALDETRRELQRERFRLARAKQRKKAVKGAGRERRNREEIGLNDAPRNRFALADRKTRFPEICSTGDTRFTGFCEQDY